MGSTITYIASGNIMEGRIAGEVAVFYSQGPIVGDRSAQLQRFLFAELAISSQWGGRI